MDTLDRSIINAFLKAGLLDQDAANILLGSLPSLPTVPAASEISEADIELAIAVWDNVFPDYSQLLEAEIA